MRVLPAITAAIDRLMFANMLMMAVSICLWSMRLTVSSANEDIVVNEPQNPTATSSAYFASRLHEIARIEKAPSMKLPKMLTSRTLTGRDPIVAGWPVIR